MRWGDGDDILQSRGIMLPTVEVGREDRIRCVPVKRAQFERCGSCGAGLGGFDEAWFQGPAFQCRFVVLSSDYGHIECVGGCRGCSSSAGEDGCEAFEQNHDAARTEEKFWLAGANAIGFSVSGDSPTECRIYYPGQALF